MAELPTTRVTHMRPFMYTRVDYADPVSIRIGRGHGSRSQKAYIGLYVCFSTKAVDIDYNAETFLGSYRRFVS